MDGDSAASNQTSEGIESPHDNDVLFGRGGNINIHPGNETFRKIVHQKKRVYLTARFKREKRIIADSILEAIKSLGPPGRFLARDAKTGLWYDVGNDKARDKTSQALRENAPSIRKEIEVENDALRAEMQKAEAEETAAWERRYFAGNPHNGKHSISHGNLDHQAQPGFRHSTGEKMFKSDAPPYPYPHNKDNNNPQNTSDHPQNTSDHPRPPPIPEWKMNPMFCYVPSEEDEEDRQSSQMPNSSLDHHHAGYHNNSYNENGTNHYSEHHRPPSKGGSSMPWQSSGNQHVTGDHRRRPNSAPPLNFDCGVDAWREMAENIFEATRMPFSNTNQTYNGNRQENHMIEYDNQQQNRLNHNYNRPTTSPKEMRTPPPPEENQDMVDWSTKGCSSFITDTWRDSMRYLPGGRRDDCQEQGEITNNSMEIDEMSTRYSSNGSIGGKSLTKVFDYDTFGERPLSRRKEASEPSIMSMGDSFLSMKFSGESENR